MQACAPAAAALAERSAPAQAELPDTAPDMMAAVETAVLSAAEPPATAAMPGIIVSPEPVVP